MKTFLLSLLTILLPFVANADAVEIDGIYYNLVSKIKEAQVTSNPNNYSGKVDIPATVLYNGEEYRVTSIVSYAFSGCKDLTSVTIPNNVTVIDYATFQGCTRLTSVSIPNSVTTIAGYAFCRCISLPYINIPNSVTSIGKNAFDGCSSLTNISIPNSITSLEDYVFYGCSNLTTITIPNSVTSIGYATFGACTNLVNITIPNSVTSIGAYAFTDCTVLSTVSIPNSVSLIEYATFSGCSGLTSVTIPSSISSIGYSAFNGCSSLTNISIPNSITSLEDYVFSDCSNLTSITIPNSVKTIKNGAFWRCLKLTNITIGSAVNSIYSQAFAYCPELSDVYCFTEIVPTTSSDAFKDSYIEYAKLHVHAESVNIFRSAEPWKSFKEIVALDGDTPKTPETPKCATPTISYKNGQLFFESETEGAEFISDITDTDIKMHYDAKVSLTATYNITVYATKSGYDDSDIATATLCWIDQQPETEGIADGLAQIPACPVLIKTDQGRITVEGLDVQDYITLFTTDGKLVGSAISQNGSASIDTHLPSGTTAIIRIGEKSVKILVK